jgi:predicted nucleotidyltransferase
MINEKEFYRWFKQAEHNLKSAKSDGEDEVYDWACFKVQRFTSHIGALTAILYGSSARGDFKDWSDIDIIISDNLPLDPIERLLYGYTKGLIEPRGFTIQEFRKILKAPFGRLLRDEGIVIYDELGIFKEEAYAEI